MSDTRHGQSLVVIGAGVMGNGIAHVSAMAGFKTVLSDISSEALDGARARIEANLEKGIQLGKVARDAAQDALDRLSLETDFTKAVGDAQIVIEAVPEKMELKQSIFETLGRLCGPEVMLGTNTSSLPITAIAAAARYPERVVGLHFFNPVHIVRLLEIITAVQTDDATLERARALGEALEREMIVVRDSPGFATSRLGLVLGLEAIRMLEAGVASAEDIDRAMELGYRHPMGPLKLTDLVGLDTRLKIAEALHSELGGEQFRPPPLLRQMVRAGKLGKKSGQGFYAW